MMADLVQQAKRDPSGLALPALRRLAFDEMLADAVALGKKLLKS
jgi:hypothetical protein